MIKSSETPSRDPCLELQCFSNGCYELTVIGVTFPIGGLCLGQARTDATNVCLFLQMTRGGGEKRRELASFPGHRVELKHSRYSSTRPCTNVFRGRQARRSKPAPSSARFYAVF